MLTLDAVHAFGVVRRVTSDVYQMTTTHLSEIAEPVGGEMLENEVDSSFEGADENDETLGEIDNPFVSLQNFSISEDVSPMSPPLTYQKFLTMQASACCSNFISVLQQLLAVENISRKIKVPHKSLSFYVPQSRRVPVVIRYSADSGMKPYFLTVAKKLKDNHPDIILEKVILPKIVAGDGKPEISPTFEVMVDGKVIIPTVGKKDRVGSAGKIVFVSMEELDNAISRARRRRRPSTVYGDDEGNARLELLKAKAAAKFARSFE
jgi:hypothetical protein